MFIFKTGNDTCILLKIYAYSQLLASLIIPALLHFPLLVTIYTVESPHAIGFISRCTPLILLDVAGHGGFF